MYTHKQLITERIFVIGQILFKIQGFEIGEMEVEHPVGGIYIAKSHMLIGSHMLSVIFILCVLMRRKWGPKWVIKGA